MINKYENSSNNFNAKFNVVQAADRFVESIEERELLWSDDSKSLDQDNNLFEAFGQIDLWDSSVDAWQSNLDIDPDEDEDDEDYDDEDYDDDDFDYEDDDDWDYDDDDDFDDDEDFDDDDD